MLQPQCRTCGQRHAIGQCIPPQISKPGKSVSLAELCANPGILGDSVTEAPCPHCGKLASEPVRPPFDKAAYQRDYMRRRRKSEQSNG